MFSDACFIERLAGTTVPIRPCDGFSSRSFIALAWPATDARRGGFFRHIVNGGFFRQENLVLFTSPGIICVEAAWIMREIEPPERLHSRDACSIWHSGDPRTAISEFSLAEPISS